MRLDTYREQIDQLLAVRNDSFESRQALESWIGGFERPTHTPWMLHSMMPCQRNMERAEEGLLQDKTFLFL